MRVAVFLDYWNFQLQLNEAIGPQRNDQNLRFKIDWKGVGLELARAASDLLGQTANLQYEGLYIYTSYNPGTDEGKKFRNWANTWLNRQPGVNVNARERKPKEPPRCPACHETITDCPHCKQVMIATVEKGVDTLIVTDLLRLGLQNSYDVAVLASSDADMVPAVEYIQTTGKKVVQAGFPPRGIDLATACWGSFDVVKLAGKIERP